MRQADRDVEAAEKKKRWDLIIRREGHGQVAAAAADLTTQLSLCTRGHQRIFNWVQSCTSYNVSCLRECGHAGFDPLNSGLSWFRITANKHKSPNLLQMHMQSQPLIRLPYHLQLHFWKADACKNANKLTDPRNPASPDSFPWSLVAGCHDQSQLISCLRRTGFLQQQVSIAKPEVSHWANISRAHIALFCECVSGI